MLNTPLHSPHICARVTHSCVSSEEGTDNVARKKQQVVIKKRTLREDWLCLAVRVLTDSAGDGSESVWAIRHTQVGGKHEELWLTDGHRWQGEWAALVFSQGFLPKG